MIEDGWVCVVEGYRCVGRAWVEEAGILLLCIRSAVERCGGGAVLQQGEQRELGREKGPIVLLP